MAPRFSVFNVMFLVCLTTVLVVETSSDHHESLSGSGKHANGSLKAYEACENDPAGNASQYSNKSSDQAASSNQWKFRYWQLVQFVAVCASAAITLVVSMCYLYILLRRNLRRIRPRCCPCKKRSHHSQRRAGTPRQLVHREQVSIPMHVYNTGSAENQTQGACSVTASSHQQTVETDRLNASRQETLQRRVRFNVVNETSNCVPSASTGNPDVIALLTDDSCAYEIPDSQMNKAYDFPPPPPFPLITPPKVLPKPILKTPSTKGRVNHGFQDPAN